MSDQPELDEKTLEDPKKCVHSGTVELLNDLLVCSACHRQLSNVTAKQTCDALRATRQLMDKQQKAHQQWMAAGMRAGFVFSVGTEEFGVEHNPEPAAEIAKCDNESDYRERIAELEQQLAGYRTALDRAKQEKTLQHVTMSNQIYELEKLLLRGIKTSEDGAWIESVSAAFATEPSDATPATDQVHPREEGETPEDVALSGAEPDSGPDHTR